LATAETHGLLEHKVWE